MDSSHSMDENVTKSYDGKRASLCEASFSSTAQASPDSSDTEEISKPPSSKGKKKISREENKNSISTTSKPSSSSKRSRERQAKEGTKSSSKKMKKSAKVDDKGNAATTVSGAEKSPRKRGLFWTSEDEVAYLKGLVAFCEKGKLRNLPKKMGLFFEVVRKDLDGQYSQDQLYSKLQWFKAKYFGVRDKIKAKGFVGFKNVHEEAVYMLSKQVWGKGEEKDVGSEKKGKEEDAGGEEKKKLVVGDARGEREEVERNKTGDLEMAVMEQEGEEEEGEDGDEDGDDEEEEEEEGHDKSEQNDNLDVKKEREASEASYVSESVRNRVVGMDTEKSEESGGEETDSPEENAREESSEKIEGEEHSSEENVGEEEDSSKEIVGEDENSSESEESETESSGSENSAQRYSNSALTQSNARENSVPHVMNGGPGRYNAGDNSRLEKLTYEIFSMTMEKLQDSSNAMRHINLVLSMRSPFERELPALSDKEVEMLDRKWQAQHLIELEVVSKRIALLQEEYQLRLAKLRHRLGKASP